MAEIVLGVATPHAPQLRLPFDGWFALQEKDETDRRIDWAAMRKAANATLQEEVAVDRMRERYAACQANLRSLSERLQQAKPDVIVVLGDDQHEQFRSDNMPMFCVYHGSTVQMVRTYDSNGKKRPGAHAWDAPRLAELQNEVDQALQGPLERPADRELGEHLIASLRDDHFDVAASAELRPDVGLGHAFRFHYQHLLPGTEIPIVPMMINTFYPPN